MIRIAPFNVENVFERTRAELGELDRRVTRPQGCR
jgi:hypothetical protein